MCLSQKNMEYAYFPKEEDKTIFINKKTYEIIIEKLGFKPSNLEVNNYLPDNQAILFNEKQLEEMLKPKYWYMTNPLP